MTQRVCFLGRGGSGKSTMAQNISHALALMGCRVLLVGDDNSLSSTVLLRGEAEVRPALEEYRAHYEIDLRECVIPTPSGVFCLELGSIDPGIGCLARGINLIDEMLETQGVAQGLGLDYILYDISGETPCTGYILPIREEIMHRCIIVISGSFASVTTANSLMQAVVKAGRRDIVPVQLLINNADRDAKDQLYDFAQGTNVDILDCVEYAKSLRYSALAGKTVFAVSPQCQAAKNIRRAAQALCRPVQPTRLTPYSRRELLSWLRAWQNRELCRLLEEDGRAQPKAREEQGAQNG